MISFTEHKTIMEMITKTPKAKEGFRRHDTTYRGVFSCVCCKGSITASRVFKTQKNGNKHEYTYYHCEKKKDENCNQKFSPINEPNLKKQILATIDKISMPEEIFTCEVLVAMCGQGGN